MDIKSYIKGQLNEEQSSAALHTDTPSLIIAGAGSGKTRVLTYKIAYLIRGKDIPANKILAVTFTNKASNEMKERLNKISENLTQKITENNGINPISDNNHQGSSDNIIGNSSKKDELEEFLESVNQNPSSVISNNHQSSFGSSSVISSTFKRVGTFHSIFLKILKEDIQKLELRYNKNFGILDSNESSSVIKDILKKLNLSEVFKPNEVKGFISNQKNNGLDPHAFIKNISSDYDQSMYKVYEGYQKELEKSNTLDFDDLLLLPYLLFKKNPEILEKRQKKFLYILVDEAQDTNRIQFELIKMLSGDDGNVTLIGDDFQSIYGRRGAIMENFLNVKKYRPDIQMFKLQTNYRSKPHIVKAGNEVIKNNLNQYEKNIIPHRTGDDKITVFGHNSEIDEAANIVDLIKKMKEGNKIKTRGSIAILYRTNAQSSPFEQILIQEGVPYKIRGAFKFFERKEIKDIISYVKYLINSQDNISLKRILNIPNRKIGKTTIENLESQALERNLTLQEIMKLSIIDGTINVTAQAKKGINDFISTIEKIKSERDKKIPSEILESLVKKIDYKSYLIKEEGSETIAEEKYENIGQLINMAQKYIQTGEDALRQFMEEVALLSDISENEQGDIDAVKLMTVHSSKGLEFPIVFVAGLEDQIFPLSNSIMEPKLLEEERRLMYVAITRAKDVLFLSHANSRLTRGQTKMNPPSRFIDEIPIELIKKFDLGGGSSQENSIAINEGDIVKHKLFGTGYVLEVWNNLAIVKFHNPKFGVRKIEFRFLVLS